MPRKPRPGRPPLGDAKRSVRLTINLRPDQHDELVKRADGRTADSVPMSVAAYVTHLVEADLAGRTGATNGGSADVVKFARRLRSDAAALSDDLRMLADQAERLH